MPVGGDPLDFEVSATLDPNSAQQIISDLGQAGRQGGEKMAAGFEVGADGVVQEMRRIGRESASRGGFGAMDDQIKKVSEALSQLGKNALGLTSALRGIGESTETIVQNIRAETVGARRASIEATNAAQTAASERIEAMRRERSLTAIEAQRIAQTQVIETRVAGQQRVAITRGIVDTIGRLEKGLGATIAGIARTTTSAIGRIYSTVSNGIGNALRRGDKEFSSTSVLRESLRDRETVIKSSFNRQEREIRDSITKQQVQLTRLQEQTQKGLLGFANNRGLFAGLAATIGIGAIARSTFTIGSEFTRGLAVLQAQLGLTADQMKAVRQASLDLGNDISLPGVSALDAAQAIQLLSKQFASLGPAAIDAATKAGKGTLQLSRAAGVTAEEAAQAVGTAVNVFGVAADKAVEVADNIAGALKQGAGVSFDDFLQSFKQGASVFSQFVTPAEGATESLTDFNTALALIARSGLVGSDAGTSLKNFFLQANRGTKEVNDALAEVSKRAGVSGTAFYDAQGNARDFSDSLDILRRGLSGLTDEQRNSRLQTIFGTDAQRVANALLAVSTEEYNKTRDAIREQGLAAKLAAAQNAGFAGALDALQSVIETIQISVYQFLEPAMKSATLAVANFVNVLSFGDGKLLSSVRQGLLGIAAGLAAVLAVKGAIEVLALLGRTLALIATPMGAILTAAALIGGAFGVMSANGLSLTEVFENVRKKVVEFGRQALDFIQPKLEQLRDFFTGSVIPAARRFADTVGDALLTAFRAVASFVDSTVIPALRRFADFITSTIVPAVTGAAKAVADFAVDVANSIVRLLGRIQPVVQPFLSGFADLGRSIGAAFGGDFSKIGSGLASAGQGIASTATRIGQNIVSALAPIAKQVASFFKGLFTLDNFMSVVDAVGTVLNFVAEKIAQLVTHPKFLAGVGIVAAGLAVIAGKWALAILTGLLQGLADNAPQLLHNVGQFLIDNMFEVGAIAVLVGAFGRQIVSAFTTIGQQGATGFAKGFGTSIKSGLSGSRDFFSSFFGGSDSALTTATQRSVDALKAQAQDLTNQFRALGDTRIVKPSQISDATRELQRLKTGFTDAQIAGLELRDRFASFGRAASAIKDGLRDVVGGVKDIGIAVGSQFGAGVEGGITAGAGRVRSGFTKIVDAFRTYAQEQGTSIGAILGKGVVAGLAAAVSGVTFGQQIGQGNSLLGLLGLGSSALGIGTALGGPLGVAAGVATLGIGAITAALTHGSEAAKQYRQDVANIASALSPGLAEAAKAGAISLEQLQRGLTFGNLGSTDLFDTAFGQLIDALNSGSLGTFQEFGISLSDQIRSIVQSGAGLSDVTSTMVDLITSSAQFSATFGKDAEAVRGLIREITKPGGATVLDDLVDAQKGAFGSDVANKYRDQINQIVSSVNDLSGAYNKTSDAIGVAGAKQFALTKSVEEAASRAGEAARNGTASTLPSAVFVPIDVKTTNTDEIDIVDAKLQAIISAKNQINQLFEQGVLPPGQTEFTVAVQQAALGVENIGKNLQEIGKSGSLDFLTGAKMDEQLRTFSQNVSNAFNEGFKTGDIIDENTARSKLQPILDAALSGLDVTADAATIQAIQDAFNNVIVELTPHVAEAKALDAAQLAVTTAQAYADGSPIGIGVTAPEIPIDSSIATAQGQADQTPIAIGVTPPEIPSNFLSGSSANLLAAGAAAGAQLGAGLVSGINSKTGAVSTAANNLAQTAIKQSRKAFNIQSPSKVFYQMGIFVGQGLANGIQSGSDDVVSAVEKLVDDAISAAQGKLTDAQRAFSAGASSLFDAFFGTDNAAGGTRIGDVGGAVTNAFNSLAGALDSSFDRAADVLKRSAEEKLNRADLDIFGEAANSLSPVDVLGAANREALVGALSSIVDVGKELISQGAPTQQVADTLTTYVDRLRILANQYGLNATDVESLVEQMGLSSGTVSQFVGNMSTLASALGQVTDQAHSLNGTIVDLFDSMIENADKFGTAVGRGGVESALASLTTAQQGIRTTLESTAQTFLDAVKATQEGGASLVQRTIAAGQGPGSLSFLDILGVQNRSAFVSAFDAVKDLAKAMLESGSSAEAVTAEINSQVATLVNFGTQLGFTAADVQHMADTLGLSGDALNKFVTAVQAAKEAAAQTPTSAAAIASPTPPGTPAASNEFTQASSLPPKIDVTINNPPYGDPAAIALAVGNRVATQIRLIGS